MKRLGIFIKWYSYITTGILIVCTVNFLLSDVESLPEGTLWQILLSGFLTTLVTVFLDPTKEGCRLSRGVRFILHYAALCIVMILSGRSFGWLELDAPGIIMMLVSVGIVYLFTAFSHYLADIRQAEEINRKLKEKYE